MAVHLTQWTPQLDKPWQMQLPATREMEAMLLDQVLSENFVLPQHSLGDKWRMEWLFCEVRHHNCGLTEFCT